MSGVYYNVIDVMEIMQIYKYNYCNETNQTIQKVLASSKILDNSEQFLMQKIIELSQSLKKNIQNKERHKFSYVSLTKTACLES